MFMNRAVLACCLFVMSLGLSSQARASERASTRHHHAGGSTHVARQPSKAVPPQRSRASVAADEQRSLAAAQSDGLAEARLLEIYRLIGQGDLRQAMTRAQNLVATHPNFQLAQLVYGDLLSSQVRQVRVLGDVPDTTSRLAEPALNDLREESRMRMKALRERPPAGTVPSQFLQLSARNRHAIAVDASRSRLYLFENNGNGLRLIADYYISVGKSGIEKAVEGDLRTPLGVYYITNTINPRSLKDYYGAGALPINYPNPLDARRGKTGSGIWLHGTPSDQYARPPKASDGCVVMANPDLKVILGTVEIRDTPVVIAPSLNWIPPQNLQPEASAFEAVLQGWRSAKSKGDLNRTLSYYASDFSSEGRDLNGYAQVLGKEVAKAGGRELTLKELSVLRWTDNNADTMVVTFGEVPDGAMSGPKKRQYWARQGNQWKIFFEGIIG